MPASPLHGVRRRLALSLLTLLTLAAAVLLAEAALRVSGTSLPDPRLYPGDVAAPADPGADPLIGWKLPPNSLIRETTADYTVVYRSNRQGFRSSRDFDEPTSARRLAFLGDSFTFGSGVEEDATFAARLARLLPETRSYNFGIGGFGIDQMWLTLRHYALPIQPDLVILSFIRNDLERSLTAYRQGHVWLEKPRFLLVDGRLERMTPEDAPGGARRWLERHSRLHGLWRRAERFLARTYPVGDIWRVNRAIFAEIHRACSAAGVPLVVVHIPVNRRHAAPLFAREFARMGIAFLDLGPLLPSDADRYYYPRDRHLTAEGHRLAAEAIHRFLAEAGLAP